MSEDVHVRWKLGLEFRIERLKRVVVMREWESLETSPRGNRFSVKAKGGTRERASSLEATRTCRTGDQILYVTRSRKTDETYAEKDRRRRCHVHCRFLLGGSCASGLGSGGHCLVHVLFSFDSKICGNMIGCRPRGGLRQH